MGKPQKKPLILIDGEIPENAPSYGEALVELELARTQVQMLERDIAGKRLRIAKLEKDRDAEARQDELWPRAIATFRYWQTLTGHNRSKFSGERFYLVAPYLRREGDAGCREAIRGCLSSDFHMKRGSFANRAGPVHDGFELIFRAQEKFDGFRRLAPGFTETLSRLTLLELADEVAGRILERAELIRAASDPETKACLLVEINALLVQWTKAPLRG